MKFILGKKIGMSQIFDERGQVIPVTLVEAGPCWVIQVKKPDKDGYQAVQIGFDEISPKKLKKPQRGHLQKVQNFGLRYLREFRIEDINRFKLGDKITAGIFNEGEVVKVSGISKAKGFQGVVKRHGFSGFPATHGTKHGLRAPGSIGSAFPERVLKGKKMAGRMGGQRVTVTGLEIAQVDKENNLLAIKGALPGRKGTLLEIIAVKEIEAVQEEQQEKLVAELEKQEKEAQEKKGSQRATSTNDQPRQTKEQEKASAPKEIST